MQVLNRFQKKNQPRSCGISDSSTIQSNQSINIMNISKSKAQDVAWKLTIPIRDEVKQVEKQVSELVGAFIEQRTPESIKQAISQHPEWFIQKAVYLDGIPLRWREAAYWDSNEVKLDAETADKVTKALYHRKDLEDKERKAREQIEATLLDIKTYKRCKEVFPDAYALLPQAELSNLMPVVQVDSIREMLGMPSPSEK